MQIPWLSKKIVYPGSVYYRGTLPQRAEDFDDLPDVSARPVEGPPDSLWALQLEHSAWGVAQIAAPRTAVLPPRDLLDFSVGLTAEEREAAATAGNQIALRMEGNKGNLLRDRKHLLRFLRLLMGDDGLVSVDHTSQQFWSRDALDEELVHDADVDITALYTLHAVQSGDDAHACGWLHTHGLAEIQALAFDIIRPADELFGPAQDILRSLAYATVEGTLTKSSKDLPIAMPGGSISAVTPTDFQARAKPEFAALRCLDDGHTDDRIVLCEPTTGFLSRWTSSVQPSKFLSSTISERCVSGFSSAASTLMASRARQTYGFLRQLRDEFADLEFPTIVKLGYPTDDDPEDREHMWFTAHDLMEASIDATLENQPFNVSKLTQGDRGNHSLELLSDWMIMTPIGPITPRFLLPARAIRANLDEIKARMRQG